MYGVAQFFLFVAVLLMGLVVFFRDIKVVEEGGMCTKVGVLAGYSCDSKCSSCETSKSFGYSGDKGMCSSLSADSVARKACEDVAVVAVWMAAAWGLIVVSLLASVFFNSSTFSGVVAFAAGVILVAMTVLTDSNEGKSVDMLRKKSSPVHLGCSSGGLMSSGSCVGHGVAYYMSLSAGVLAVGAALPLMNGAPRFVRW